MGDIRDEMDTLPVSSELLSYYRHRIDSFEQEREDLLCRLQDVEVSRAEFHEQEWTLLKRDEEVFELKQALSELQVFLFEEREQALALHAENDDLRIQEMEDRRRIQHLLAIAAPQHQEVTYFKESRPDYLITNPAHYSESAHGSNKSVNVSVERSSQHSKSTHGRPQHEQHGYALGKSQHQVATKEKCPKRGTGRTKSIKVPPPSRKKIIHGSAEGCFGGVCGPAGGGDGKRVLRTIFVNEEAHDALQATVSSLREQLEAERKLHKEKEEALLEDRRLRIAEMKKQFEADMSKMTQMQKDKDKLAKQLARSVRDYLVLRHNSQISQRVMKEDNESLRSQILSSNHNSEKLQKQSNEALRKANAENKQSTEAALNRLRKQVVAKDEDIANLTSQYSALVGENEDELQSLTAQVSRWKTRFKRLTSRRGHEVEGFKTDVSRFKNEIRDLEALIMKMSIPTAGDLEYRVLDTARLNAELGTEVHHVLRNLKSELHQAENVLAGVPNTIAA